MSNSDSKQRLITIAALLIVALLASNVYFLWDKSQKTEKIEEQNREIAEIEAFKVDLEKQAFNAQKELDEMKGDNEKLNALIDEQKEALAEKEKSISRLIRSGKVSKSDLEDARAQLSEMIRQREQFLAEINSLKLDKENLTKQAVALTEEKTILQEEVQKEKVMNEELTSAKATLVSQKDDLEAQKLALSKKVSVGSVVKVDDLDITGWKIKKTGKAAKKKYAKNIDRLKICFTAESNDVVSSGVEQFHLRLIDPLGETLTDESYGSGILLNNKTDEEVRFTTLKEFEYNNVEQQTCLNWEPALALSKGNYQVEVYNKGYLSGTGVFNLK